MTFRWRDQCAAHQAALNDFVDRRAGYDPGAARGVPAALDHLERCRDCELELGATALVVAALRRMADDVDAVEPSPDAWNRLAVAIAPTRERRSILASPLAGLAVSAGLVVALLAPLGFDLAPSADIASIPAADSAALQEEERWLRERSQGTRSAADRTPPDAVRVVVAGDRIGPDGVQLQTLWGHETAPPGRQL